MSGQPHPRRVAQSDLDAVLSAIRTFSEVAEACQSAALLIESNAAIVALLDAAEFDGVEP